MSDDTSWASYGARKPPVIKICLCSSYSCGSNSVAATEVLIKVMGWGKLYSHLQLHE